MRSKRLVAFCWVLAIAGAGLPSTSQSGDWSAYRDAEIGYQIEYPAGWKVTESLPRTKIQREIFIREPEGKLWPGEFAIRVHEPPSGVTLDEWADARFLDVHDESLVTGVEDATLAGRPARRFSIFGFDQTGIVVALAHDGRIFELRYSGSNPNDPDIEEHTQIYLRMERSFRLVAPGRES